ncbi:hypothetical protein HYY75_01050 [bacterium]|nr:hypothetical protein [bacterium]
MKEKETAPRRSTSMAILNSDSRLLTSGKSGYLLMEALLAMLLLAAIVGGMLSSIMSANSEMKDAKVQAQTTMLCEAKIEELRWRWGAQPAIGGWGGKPPINPVDWASGAALTVDPASNPRLFIASYTIATYIINVPLLPPNDVATLYRLTAEVFPVTDLGGNFIRISGVGATLTTLLAPRGP